MQYKYRTNLFQQPIGPSSWNIHSGLSAVTCRVHGRGRMRGSSAPIKRQIFIHLQSMSCRNNLFSNRFCVLLPEELLLMLSQLFSAIYNGDSHIYRSSKVGMESFLRTTCASDLKKDGSILHVKPIRHERGEVPR